MERIALGPDGIGVSRLCLGAMALGAILDRFVALGGNFIDTSDCFSAHQGYYQGKRNLLRSILPAVQGRA